MLDFFGRPISIGDNVICRYVTCSTAYVTIGTVTDFTPKKVKLTVVHLLDIPGTGINLLPELNIKTHSNASYLMLN
jgi:hypothetical protein